MWVSDTVLVAVLSLVGTLFGSLGGIMAANKLTIYRIEQLEKKVEKHNNVLERVYVLEKNEAVIEEEIEVANHRIADLENYHK
jgi:TPP-dependent indolepyruvate ferredoxin oxidoreductase alpha subunit